MVLAAVLVILLLHLDTVRADSQAQGSLSILVIGAGKTTADTTEGPDGPGLLTGGCFARRATWRAGGPRPGQWRDDSSPRTWAVCARPGVALLDEVLTFAVRYRALAL